MKANITNKEGKNVSVYMGSYGIGVSRLVAAIIEYSHDKKGIIWPNSVTPFHVGIINVQVDNKECLKEECCCRSHHSLACVDRLKVLGFGSIIFPI